MAAVRLAGWDLSVRDEFPQDLAKSETTPDDENKSMRQDESVKMNCRNLLPCLELKKRTTKRCPFYNRVQNSTQTGCWKVHFGKFYLLCQKLKVPTCTMFNKSRTICNILKSFGFAPGFSRVHPWYRVCAKGVQRSCDEIPSVTTLYQAVCDFVGWYVANNGNIANTCIRVTRTSWRCICLR